MRIEEDGMKMACFRWSLPQEGPPGGGADAAGGLQGPGDPASHGVAVRQQLPGPPRRSAPLFATLGRPSQPWKSA